MKTVRDLLDVLDQVERAKADVAEAERLVDLSGTGHERHHTAEVVNRRNGELRMAQVRLEQLLDQPLDEFGQ